MAKLSRAAEARGERSKHAAARNIFTESLLGEDANLAAAELTLIRARLDDLGDQLDSFRSRFEEVVTRRTA